MGFFSRMAKETGKALDKQLTANNQFREANSTIEGWINQDLSLANDIAVRGGSADEVLKVIANVEYLLLKSIVTDHMNIDISKYEKRIKDILSRMHYTAKSRQLAIQYLLDNQENENTMVNNMFEVEKILRLNSIEKEIEYDVLNCSSAGIHSSQLEAMRS